MIRRFIGATSWLLFAAGCKDSSHSPTTIQTSVGPVEVREGPIPAGSEFMCSADYQTHPVAELHVVPTFNDSLGTYVGGYRCNADWKAAIEETRKRVHAHPSADEVAMLMRVFVDRGVTTEELRTYVAGKSPVDAADAVLDALGSDKLRITP